MCAVLDLGESAATEDPGPLDPNSWATSKRGNMSQEIVQDLTQRNTEKAGSNSLLDQENQMKC